jgi:hypothetical protein
MPVRSQLEETLTQAASAGTEEAVPPLQPQAQGAVMGALRPQVALAQAASARAEEVEVSPQLQARGAVMAAGRPLNAVTQAAEETGTPQLPQLQAPVIAVQRPQEALARAVAPGLALTAVP